MIRQIDVHQLNDRLTRGESVHLIDVRQPWEHDTVALPSSQLIPLDQLTLRASEIRTAAALLVVYCHHGIRSQSGAALLMHLGYRNVASLAGGIDAWSLHIDPRVPRY